MKHLTFAGKTMFTGDEAADALVEYAAALAHAGDADSVKLNVVGSDGNRAEAHFLLDTGAPLMAESTDSPMEEPDNSEATAYMRRRTKELGNPRPLDSSNQPQSDDFDDLDFDLDSPPVSAPEAPTDRAL